MTDRLTRAIRIRSGVLAMYLVGRRGYREGDVVVLLDRLAAWQAQVDLLLGPTG